MRPTRQQLQNWCDAHHIGYDCGMTYADLRAYTHDRRNIITRVLIEGEQADPDEIAVFLRACAQIAYELCIVPPQVALALNHPSYRQ